MSDIKDLFGEFSTPFKKLEMKKLADRMEEARRKQRKNAHYEELFGL